jgi:hypothetical protein
MRGTVRKISLPRRFIVELMRASMRVPFVSLRRTLDIRQLLETRAHVTQPPGWAAIFVKAFALVASDEPVLRTLYVKWPRAHFFELPCSVAMVAIARVEDGQDCILPEKVAAPEKMALIEIDAQIRRAKHGSIDEIPTFRRIIQTTRLPLPLRRLVWAFGLNLPRLRANYFGSFGVTSVAAYGPGELHAVSPGPFIVTYGVVNAEQTIDVVIRWDHRVTDAAFISKVLTQLEKVLNSEIAAELRGQQPLAGPGGRA